MTQREAWEPGARAPGSQASRVTRQPLDRRRAAAAAAARRRAAELGDGTDRPRLARPRLARPRVGRRRWAAPAAQALALAAILAVNASVLVGVQADLAADRGSGRVVPVAVVDEGVSPPIRLSVPALDVQTRLIGLRKDPSGALQVPEDPQQAGWYSQGFAPGGAGPAVIVGHVDSYRGPGIFHRLGAMKPGELVSIRRADGSLAVFEVTSVETFSKRDFPTERVYRGDGSAGLRLVTCGGEFDRGARTYLSNVVVFASPYDEAAAKTEAAANSKTDAPAR